MMLLKTDECSNSSPNRRQAKQHAKQLDAVEDVRHSSQRKAAVVVAEESKSQPESKLIQQLAKNQLAEVVRNPDDDAAKDDADDMTDIVRAAEVQSATKDVIGECKICLDDIELAELY